MVRRYGLRDDQWERMEHVLPGREATVGVTAKDTRLFGEAVMYRYRTGIPWRDLPERFGDGKTHHRRHRRGSESRYGKEGLRLWRRMPTTKTPDRLHECPGPPAQRQRKRGGRETECLGRRKGGLTTNLHAAGDALGNPTGFHLTPGRVNDPEGADALLPHLLASMQAFLADKAYEARERGLDRLEKAGVQSVTPPRTNRKEQRAYDEDEVESQISDREFLRHTPAVQGHRHTR